MARGLLVAVGMEQAQQNSVNYFSPGSQVHFSADPQVLIIEKESHMARFMEFFLQKEGYTTAVIHEKSRIIPGIRDLNPPMILLDLEVTEGPGLEVLNSILANKSPHTFLFVVTKKIFDVSTRKDLLRSVDTLCAKPMAPSTLLNRLTNLGIHPASK